MTNSYISDECETYRLSIPYNVSRMRFKSNDSSSLNNIFITFSSISASWSGCWRAMFRCI